GIELASFLYQSKKRRDVRNALDIPDSTVVFGHIGRFNEQKNHHHLIDIFASVQTKNPDIMLVLVGDGVLKKSVEAKVYRMGLEKNVLFLGVRPDISALLQAMDIFIMPSLHEGLPVTLIEAQCADLPCMISETITKEADMGLGLLHYLPLHDLNQWIFVSEQLIASDRERKSRPFALKKHGYDIKVTAE